MLVRTRMVLLVCHGYRQRTWGGRDMRGQDKLGVARRGGYRLAHRGDGWMPVTGVVVHLLFECVILLEQRRSASIKRKLGCFRTI